MDRDSITRTGARAPGVERLDRSHGGARKRLLPDTEQGIGMIAQSTKDASNQFAGKAASDMPALKPKRGKPAVRNFRGGDGNVGIIRSPVRAIALPDVIRGMPRVAIKEGILIDVSFHRPPFVLSGSVLF